MNLKEYIKKRGISIQAISDVMGLTYANAYQTIITNRKIKMDEAIRIKQYTRMSEAEFVDMFNQCDWFDTYRSM